MAVPKTKEERRAYGLNRKYGLTREKYKEMFFKQSGNCAICKVNQSQLKYELCVDHCHLTQRVRGLLCQSCNTGLARFKDDETVVKTAYEYLTKK